MALSLFQKVGVLGTDHLLFWTISRQLFEARLMVFCQAGGSCNVDIDEEISLDEKDIIMYACGYVPVALIHCYE